MSIYKDYNDDQLQELFSNFLISSWSYSKVTSFARNEKAFEMQHIFGMYGKSSATSVAGSAYHEALDKYFKRLQQGEEIDLVDMEGTAFNYIEGVPANKWKVQKTTPTIEDCKEKAFKTSVTALKNFLGEIGVYTDDIEEILAVELYCDEFLTINGVDIPLPAHGKIDLVFRSKEQKIVVLDHKLKSSFTPEEEIALSIGCQAITYVKLYEAKTGLTVDEVRFVENKHSQNKDKSSQLNCFKVQIDDNTRALYEALLYEPLKRMLEAVQNPDYVYLINDSDKLTDMAELYDFWAKTMISEIEDFNIEESKKKLVAMRLRKIRDASIVPVNPNVIKHFRESASSFIQYDLSNKNMTHAEKIEHSLKHFGSVVRVAHKVEGYSSDTYLVEPSAGVRIASIHSRRLDIANALDVENVIMSNELIVYGGKSYLGIDVPKKRVADLLFDAKALQGMKIPLGKDNFGNLIAWDLENNSTPHVLVCGATGSGKSVLIKTTAVFADLAGTERIIIFDPKYEFGAFRNIAAVFNDIEDIESEMALLVEDMNRLVKEGKSRKTVIIFDEFADAVSNARKGKALGGEKSLEENLKILLQKGRSSGFRIMAATQRASVKVITGDAKVNFPVQICFRVPKEADSRVVLDEPGAEALQGAGDGLIKSPEYKNTVRFQAFYKPAEVPA